MINQHLDWRRRRWHGEVPTEVLPERAGADGSSPELAHVLAAAVRDLPPRRRAVVVLRYFEDLTEAATAAAMGCSVGTVKSQSSKALASLRRHPDLTDLQLEGSAS